MTFKNAIKICDAQVASIDDRRDYQQVHAALSMILSAANEARLRHPELADQPASSTAQTSGVHKRAAPNPTAEQVTQVVWAVLAAILHMGNIRFEEAGTDECRPTLETGVN
jgi:hypothetical protein